MRFASLILLAACAAGAPAIERVAPAERASAPQARRSAPVLAPVLAPGLAPGLAPVLGMNDVSILLPLPRDPRAPVLAAIASAGLVERGWFDALVTDHHDIAPRVAGPIAFEDFQVVAVRFDLCERATVGVCPPDVDGRLRLVLQPMYLRAGATAAHDVALHAFYPVPAVELAQVIDELRALARRQALAPDAALTVSPAAAAGDAAYLAQLRALVVRYARGARLARLTVIGQVADSAAFAWIFRGLERRGDAIVTLEIPGVAKPQQTLQLAGGDTVYQTAPVADAPAGFALAINGPRFAAATPAERTGALAALTAIQNPLVHDTINTQCIACHVATFLTARRAIAIGLAPAAIAGRFTSRHALAVNTIAGADPRVVRGFGWAASVPAISQRVVNDTAQVLAEIEARFPASPR
ncbi:MAG: hypothetical protein ABIY55_16945 [Kofleriaceae bacterium]